MWSIATAWSGSSPVEAEVVEEDSVYVIDGISLGLEESFPIEFEAEALVDVASDFVFCEKTRL